MKMKLGWKEQMAPLHSNAEWRIFDALKRAGLRSLLMDETLILKRTLDDDEVEFPTYPDFYYRKTGNEIFLVYLDGPPHLKRCVEQRDDVVNAALDRAGIKYKRYPYKAPLSDKRFKEIVDDVVTKIKGHP